MERRWCLMCVLALLACNQSLFDSSPGDKDGGAGGGDGGGGDIDGSVPVSDCPEPCAGDAAADFGEAQGANDVWFYLRDLGSPNGADYEEMIFGTWGELNAWTNGPEGPAVASCTGQNGAGCEGLDGFVLLVPGPDNERPALAFRAPETATYSITGAARIADGGPTDVPVQILFSRAGRHDAVALQTIRTSTTEVGLSGVVPAIEGDEITISIGSDEAIPPLGVRLFYTRVDSGAEMFPGSCQVALRFDSGASLEESCRNTTVIDDSFTGMTTSGPGPSGRLGEARVFVVDQYLQVGNGPMDYRADFTVQFWSQFTEPQPDFQVVPFADTSDPSSRVHGGQVILRPSSDVGDLELCYYHHDVEGNRLCLFPEMPTDGAWHFWRITRSTDSGRYQLCIDGAEITSTTVPSDADMTSDEPPRLGRFVNFTPPYFTGSLDEVRVFSEALPCVTTP
jgi:hypothetical protein